MNRFKRFLLLAAGFILAACSTDPVEEFAQPEPEPARNRHAVPIEQALDELHDLLGVIDGEGTRAGGARTVGSIETLNARALPQTRSAADPAEQPEELLYVVNFEGGQGYAVLGADDRLPAVLAVADQGSLTTDELVRAANGQTVPEEFTYPNELLMAYASGLGGIGIGGGGIGGGIGGGGIGGGGGGIGGGGTPPGPFTDFDRQLGDPDPFFSHYEWTDWKILTKIPAIIFTKWDQIDPYNCFCPPTGQIIIDNDKCAIERRCYAGCVPIACAQITAYHSNVNAPQIIGNNVINWDLIHRAMSAPYIPKILHNNIPQATSAVGVFIRSVGDAVVTKYGAQGSSASTKDAETFFRWLGYQDVYRRGYDWEGIRTSLINYRMPVFICGYSTSSGHAWILDGILQQQQDKLYVSKTGDKHVVDSKLRYFVHCNYGWGGSKDGYYDPGIFDTAKGPIIHGNSTGPKDFSAKLEIITYTSVVK